MTRQFQTTQPQLSHRSLPADRRGRLRNGARPGDFLAARRCGARARHGGACQQPGMRNGRCRFHGGKSTGPRTAEGWERCRLAATRHGGYSREIKALRREASYRVMRLRALTAIARGVATAGQIGLVHAIIAESAGPVALDATAGHGVPCSQVGRPAPAGRYDRFARPRCDPPPALRGQRPCV